MSTMSAPSTVKSAVRETLLAVAVMVTFLSLLTAVVEIVNVALVELAGTVTDEGTVAELPLLLRFTLIPPDGALLVKVTVPVTDDAPTTESGESVTVASVGGFT
jgi:hypothetical protein